MNVALLLLPLGLLLSCKPKISAQLRSESALDASCPVCEALMDKIEKELSEAIVHEYAAEEKLAELEDEGIWELATVDKNGISGEPTGFALQNAPGPAGNQPTVDECTPITNAQLRMQCRFRLAEQIHLDLSRALASLDRSLRIQEGIFRELHANLIARLGDENSWPAGNAEVIAFRLHRQTLETSKISNDSAYLQVAQAEANFNRLAEEMVQNRVALQSINVRINDLSRRLNVIPVMRPQDVRREIQREMERLQQQEGANQASLDSAFFHHPRSEVYIIDSFDTNSTITVGPQMIFGAVQAGYTYHYRDVAETLMASEGLEHMLTDGGVTRRATSVMCQAFFSKNYQVSANGHINASFMGVGVGSASTMVGTSREFGVRKTSKIFNIPQNTTVASQVNRCRAWAQHINSTDPMDVDMANLNLDRPRTEILCTRDNDCRDVPATKGWMAAVIPNTISECRFNSELRRKSCSLPRLTENGGTCHLPTVKQPAPFTYPCAKGLDCNSSAQCVRKSHIDSDFPHTPDQTIRNWASALYRANIDRIELFGSVAIDDFMNIRQRDTFCTDGYLPGGRRLHNPMPSGEGWHLPSNGELYAIAIWELENARTLEKTRAEARRNASRWYYPPGAFDGAIWAVDNHIWVRGANGKAPFNISDPRAVARLLTPLVFRTEANGNETTEIIATRVASTGEDLPAGPRPVLSIHSPSISAWHKNDGYRENPRSFAADVYCIKPITWDRNAVVPPRTDPTTQWQEQGRGLIRPVTTASPPPLNQSPSVAPVPSNNTDAQVARPPECRSVDEDGNSLLAEDECLSIVGPMRRGGWRGGLDPQRPFGGACLRNGSSVVLGFCFCALPNITHITPNLLQATPQFMCQQHD